MKIISLKISLFFESIFFHTEKFSVNRKQQPRLEKMVKLRKAELIPRPNPTKRKRSKNHAP